MTSLPPRAKIEKPKFVEIGVGDYSESNTRFIFERCSSEGLIIDSIDNFKEKVTSRVEGHTGPIDPDLVTVRSSRKNNYISVNITIAATGEEQLSEIFEDLKKIKSVKMVL